MATKPKFEMMTGAAFTTAVGKLGKTIERTGALIQTLAVNAIGFSVKDRNTTPATQLVAAVGKGGIRRDALVRFMEQNGNLKWSKEKEAFEFMDFQKADAWTTDRAIQLMGLPWTSAKPENKLDSMYDVESAVEKLLSTIDKRIKDGKAVEHAELAKKIRAVVAEYHAEQYATAADGGE